MLNILTSEQGKFEILNHNRLQEQLLIIERAGRTCYKSERGEITQESADKFIRKIMRRGHESVIEHSLLSVLFYQVSRGFTHEMVRHRLCAFSQESTRYVDYESAQPTFILPEHRDMSEPILVSDLAKIEKTPTEIMDHIGRYYSYLRRAGWKPEDARQFLPIGTASSIVVSTNFREWRHIFTMRTNKAAHWEIRRVMCNLLACLKNIIPVIFEDFKYSGDDNNGVPVYRKAELENT